MVPLATNLLFIAILGFVLYQVEREARVVEHSRSVVSQANLIARLPFDACMGLIAYNLTRSKVFQDSYERSVNQIPEEINTLRRLTEDEPQMRIIVNNIAMHARDGVALIEEARRRADETSDAVSLISSATIRGKMDKVIMKLVSELDTLMKVEESETGLNRSGDSSGRNILELALMLGIGANVLVAVVLTLFFNRSISQRLDLLVRNTGRFARGEELDANLIGGEDELAELDSKFRAMAAAIDQASRQERAVFENASDVICSIDEGKRFARVNPACESVWGYEEEYLRGRRLIDIVLANDHEKTLESMDRLAGPESNGEFENRILKSDGSIVYMLWSVYWSAPERSFICVAHDINARKEAEKLKQEFLEMVSHDIKTPLASVSATFEIMEAGVRPERMEKDIGIGRRNIKKVIALLDELLDIQRLEAGKLDLDLELFDARDLVNEAIESVAGTAEKKRIRIVEPDDTAVIRCDVDRIRQVIINLLSNAIKYSEPGGKIVTGIGGEAVDVKLWIEDEGKGIPEEHLGSIFDRFQQVTMDDAKSKGGKGLGLAICKAIVDAHSGKIGVDSVEGSGSTFWIVLPGEREPDDA